jgi:K+-sensing histidine kinase KdpD
MTLLNNAIKLSNLGGVIKVRAFMVKNTIRIAVQDYGDGMNKKHFEAMINSEKRDTCNQWGFDLGLKISRDQCRSLGGDLLCTNTKDKGTLMRMQVSYLTHS